MISQKNIAKELGISQGVVSRVLTGRMGRVGVSTKTRDAILQKARDMGYQPNQAAVSLRCGRKGVVAVFIHPMGSPGSELVSRFLKGVTQALNASQYNLMLHFFDKDDDFLAAFNGSIKNQIDGLIIAGVPHPGLYSRFRQIKKSGMPLVSSIECDRDGIAWTHIALDGEKLCYLTARHLLEQGCRRLAHFRTQDPLFTTEGKEPDRYQGFLQAHKDCGVPVRNGLVLDAVSFRFEEGARCAEKLLASKKSFDGIVASSDAQAFAALQVLTKHGVKVPEEVKVTGIDDSPLAEAVGITSTTVEMEQRGRLCVELLLKAIEQKPVRSITLLPQLVVRESTRK